ncbi:cyclin-dependent kinase inhibitor 1B isoform 2-T2 [Podargus strigoides]
MSNVRISNGSPTLERMEARQSEYPKPSACRNLFGPVNHEELNRDLVQHRRELEAACQRRWNFDFQNHKPLEGRRSRGTRGVALKRLRGLRTGRTLQSTAPGRGKDLPPTIPLLTRKEPPPPRQKQRSQRTPPAPVQWSKPPRNAARGDPRRKRILSAANGARKEFGK